MAQPSTYEAGDGDRTLRSTPALRWAEARNVMLTDNSTLDPEDPLRCMDLLVSPWQVENVQRCIKTLYQGLRWAHLLKIKGGYAGQRHYSQLFLIDDPYIIGVFDDRNFLRDDVQMNHHAPQTLEELIHLYNQGQGNIKTLIVFEKPNLRLANSDEEARQSYFVAETIYPALTAIVQVLNQSDNLQYKCLTSDSSRHLDANNDEIQLAKTSEDINQDFLKLSPLFTGLFTDPGQANKILLQKSPLQFFCNTNSPLNLDIDDELFSQSMTRPSAASEEENSKAAEARLPGL